MLLRVFSLSVYVTGLTQTRINRFTGHKGTIYSLISLTSPKSWSANSAPPSITKKHLMNGADDSYGNATLASASSDSTIKLWKVDGASTVNCLQELRGHTSAVFTLAALGNGKLASGSADNTLIIWDTALARATDTRLAGSDIYSGSKKFVLNGHTNYIKGLAPMMYNHIASGSLDGTIKIWDHRTGQLKVTLEHKCYDVTSTRASSMWSGYCPESGVMALAALGEHSVVSGGIDGTIKVWKIFTKTSSKTWMLRARDNIDQGHSTLFSHTSSVLSLFYLGPIDPTLEDNRYFRLASGVTLF
jgi:WD40 repeat protein